MDYPTERQCIFPIQLIVADREYKIEGGTALLFEKERHRYLITARHVWEGMLSISDCSIGRRHGAFVVFENELLALKRDEIVHTQETDVIVFRPSWLPSIDTDFYNGVVAPVVTGDSVISWGFPGAHRTLNENRVECLMKEISGLAMEPCNGHFRFRASYDYLLGGFSGAPVFTDNSLVGIVSEGTTSDMGCVVRCCDLTSVCDDL